MPTVADINVWLTREQLSRKQLSDMLGVNHKALCMVLNGKRSLSKGLESRIEQIMNKANTDIMVRIDPGKEKVLRAWAELRGMTFEQIVDELLEQVLNIRK